MSRRQEATFAALTARYRKAARKAQSNPNDKAALALVAYLDRELNIRGW